MPVGKDYSREAAVSLRADDADCNNLFAGADYTKVEIDDGIRVDQTANTGQYAVFLFKDAHTQQEPFAVQWNGQSSLAPSASAVYLQIYNRTLAEWESLANNNAESAGVDFTLQGSKSTNLGNYFDVNFEIACRVYQQIT